MSEAQTRQTDGRGRRYDSVVDTIGDTPCIRINSLAPDHVTVFVKAEPAELCDNAVAGLDCDVWPEYMPTP